MKYEVLIFLQNYIKLVSAVSEHPNGSLDFAWVKLIGLFGLPGESYPTNLGLSWIQTHNLDLHYRYRIRMIH